MLQNVKHRGRVIIIGGSMGGLFAGLRFMTSGWDAHIYERVEQELDARGAGIVTHEELFDAMRLVGVDPGDDIGVAVRGRSVWAKDGKRICQREWRQVMTSWGLLYGKLLAAFPRERYYSGMELVEVREKGEIVQAVFADGTVAEGDLLVAADGIHSTVRTQLAAKQRPEYCGYVAWRALVPEQELTAAFRRDVFMDFSFCLPPGEQFVGYPVAGPNNDLRAGHRNYNIVWYRPADPRQDLPFLLTDVDGINNGVSIAPNRIRKTVIDAMFSDAQSILASQFAEVLLKTARPFIQPVFDLTTPRMSFGSVAVVGDAAFVARPHVGMGVTKAADDAIALVDCCEKHGNLRSGLETFDRKRRPECSFIVQHARDLGCYLEPHEKTEAERRFAQKQCAPAAVLENSGDTKFLREFRQKWASTRREL
ncbi:MAG: FAD-dependent oxidoreductase [Hyphomicrobiaceae bacterium]